MERRRRQSGLDRCLQAGVDVGKLLDKLGTVSERQCGAAGWGRGRPVGPPTRSGRQLIEGLAGTVSSSDRHGPGWRDLRLLAQESMAVETRLLHQVPPSARRLVRSDSEAWVVMDMGRELAAGRVG